jgi:hypothetical protein
MIRVEAQVLGDGKVFGAALRRDLADTHGLSVAKGADWRRLAR